MKDFLVIFITGFLCFIAGILLWIRERRLFRNSVTTNARVAEYYEYSNERGHPMYTMAAEYTLTSGEHIRASEQKGSNRRKYQVGDDLEIVYSVEKPDFFIVKGDHTRTIVLIGMIIVGAGMCVASFTLLFPFA